MTHYINKMLFLMIEDVERSEDGKSQEGKQPLNINEITFLMLYMKNQIRLRKTTNY